MSLLTKCKALSYVSRSVCLLVPNEPFVCIYDVVNVLMMVLMLFMHHTVVVNCIMDAKVVNCITVYKAVNCNSAHTNCPLQWFIVHPVRSG